MAVSLTKIQFDTDDLEEILVGLHGPEHDRLRTAVRNRLIYLQKRGFPRSARAGRGRRSVHDLPDALRTLFAFELMNLHIPPTTAIGMIAGSWSRLRDELLRTWNALDRRRADRSGPPAAETGRIALAQPHLLSRGPEAKLLTFASPAELHCRLSTGTAMSSFVVVDMGRFLETSLAAMAARLQIDVGNIDGAMANMEIAAKAEKD